MIILLTGSGTGGHFYPLIAVARALRAVAEKEHIIKLELFFADDVPFDPQLLIEENIRFIKIPSGKLPRYASIRYLTSPLKIIAGIAIAFWKLYILLPDVVFSKGGYAAFPVLVAARILRIPVIIHESDAVPGKVNAWSARWATRVAISFPQSAEYFKASNVALTGNPIRHQIIGGTAEEALETFALEENVPVILVLGGSQGAERINEVILDMLPETIVRYQIIHQIGSRNIDEVQARSTVILRQSPFKHRYHTYGFLPEVDLRNASHIASIVITRAGAGSIFEAAAWRLPAILIPLPRAAQDHQRENAYAYARFGGCEVIEETNLTPHIVLSAVYKILGDPQKITTMKRAAQEFARLDAAERIAEEIIKIGIHD